MHSVTSTHREEDTDSSDDELFLYAGPNVSSQSNKTERYPDYPIYHSMRVADQDEG